MKKTLSLLLTLCLLLGLLPMEAAAYVGDIQRVNSDTVTANPLPSGSLELRNDYLRVIVRKDGTLSTAPAADSADPVDRQTPFCYLVAYDTKHTTYPANLRPKSVEFADKTPNGPAAAIKVEYDLTFDLKKLTATGTTTVYYEIVQLGDSGSGAWGVLTSVNNIVLDMEDRGELTQTLHADVGVFWGYTLSGFTAMGHRNAADSPALKLSRTVYDQKTSTELSSENFVLTSKVENLDTQQDMSRGAIGATTISPRSIRTATTGPIPLLDCRNTIKTGPSRPTCRTGSA